MNLGPAKNCSVLLLFLISEKICNPRNKLSGKIDESIYIIWLDFSYREKTTDLLVFMILKCQEIVNLDISMITTVTWHHPGDTQLLIALRIDTKHQLKDNYHHSRQETVQIGLNEVIQPQMPPTLVPSFKDYFLLWHLTHKLPYLNCNKVAESRRYWKLQNLAIFLVSFEYPATLFMPIAFTGHDCYTHGCGAATNYDNFGKKAK